MEKCFVDSVCPPLRIQQAAVEIGHWFADNNIKHWELANCASRDSFEQLRQRVAEKDEVIAEAGEMLAMRDRQLAALKAENEWRDIETAPKDNAVFLAWRKHATHPLMVRYEPSYDWFANYDGEHVYDLTHWMPLPKPPAMAQGEK